MPAGHALLHYCCIAALLYCLTGLLLYCITVAVLHYFITALQHYSITALLRYCIALRALVQESRCGGMLIEQASDTRSSRTTCLQARRYCLTALLPYCLTALLLYCITALLLYCFTALLRYCIALRASGHMPCRDRRTAPRWSRGLRSPKACRPTSS